MDFNDLLETALDAAWAAAEVHRTHLGSVQVADWSEKGVADFVTHVDREAEERIVAIVSGRHPDHAILAEEQEGGRRLAERREDDGRSVERPAGAPAPADPAGHPVARADSSPEWLWIVDPLDGTTNYLHGYPMYAASVAVTHRGRPVAAAVVCGATGEAWTASRGGGAFKDGRPIRVSEIRMLRHALIGTGFPFKALDLLPAYLRQFDMILRRTAGIRRAGSAALDLCHVATGYFDGFWELVLEPWDVAAGTLIVREAGGVVTTLEGGPDVLRRAGAVLAGNPAIHAALRELLSPA